MSCDKLAFGIATIWQEPRDHCMDSYFYFVKTSRYNKKNKYKIEYPSLLSAIYPQYLNSAEIPKTVFTQLPSLDDLDSDVELSESHDADLEIEDDSAHKRIDQNELNDLACDLGLSKRL